MIDVSARQDLARRLWDARTAVRPVPPLIETHPALDVADSYEIQSINIRRELDDGARLVGHKIGLTSAAMQQMMGVDVPDFGHLLDTMVLDITRPVPLAGFVQPRVEVEIAYVLGSELRGPGVTREDVEAAATHVLPCLELIDSRIRDWRIGLMDTIADNASSAAVLLGAHEYPVDAIRDPRDASLLINGAVVAEGSTADVLGHPAEAVAWLANALGEFGVPLKAGHLVLSGSCTRAVDVRPGDRVSARFDGLGSVDVDFE
ncbi:fumarylacetoacetate hydrolase family protein [Microbacterium sp. zg-Y818]|uniref:2-keto-4-pentenoate hydratase n=1 Tax=unclassified Microbacterium TaxID=2609290 RepID=UPI00214BB248|nr:MULTISPECIES: fumarylacetoacetate hydrolase family protein [unclassified Microbacterium]MCR2799372.1 fumarylacetoacetate hydrolase family protein [Microbacterium sp. zg.Y818]WIM21371.1 fumarylacetoacetate hydrolase family protein [Microbacterium sp. zg-Y818]